MTRMSAALTCAAVLAFARRVTSVPPVLIILERARRFAERNGNSPVEPRRFIETPLSRIDSLRRMRQAEAMPNSWLLADDAWQ